YTGVSASHIMYSLRPILAVEKSFHVPEAFAGSVVNMTVWFNNTGADIAHTVWLNDTLPAGLAYVSDTSGVIPVLNEQSVSWVLSGVTTGSHHFMVTLMVDSDLLGSVTVYNNITLNYTDNNGDLMEGHTDTASIILTGIGQPNVTVAKISATTVVNPGDNFDYIIYINNTGTVNATTVWLDDTLPAGIAYVSDTFGVDVAENGNVLSWVLVDVTPGTHMSVITVEALWDAAASLVQANTVQLNYTDMAGRFYPGSIAMWEVTFLQPDVTVSKSVDLALAEANSTLAYTITVENLGPGFAGAVTVQDMLPVGTTLVSHNADTLDSYTGHTYIGNLLTIYFEHIGIEVLEFSVVVQTAPLEANGTVLNNTVTVDYTDVAATLVGSVEDYAETTLFQIPWLMVEKNNDELILVPDSLVTFTITLVNPSLAESLIVDITEEFENLTYIFDDISLHDWITEVSPFVYIASHLQPGVYTFNITFRLPADATHNETYLNTVTVHFTDVFGNHLGQISATSVILVDMPPVITHVPVTHALTLFDMDISALVEDDYGVAEVWLYWTNWTGTHGMRMTGPDNDVTGNWDGTIPGQPSRGTITYYIVAVDIRGNIDVVGQYQVSIFLPPYVLWGTVALNGVAKANSLVMVSLPDTGEMLFNVTLNIESWLDPVTGEELGVGQYRVDLADMPSGYYEGTAIEVYAWLPGPNDLYYAYEGHNEATVTFFTGFAQGYEAMEISITLRLIPEYWSILAPIVLVLMLYAASRVMSKRKKRGVSQ
ncbi:MAG TPA: DUF11 domain-containing protein, partial [Euryarchaeota archaeon]|nr:DUF11 domain-containing protein [Euryarchaeota archaeon]